MACSKYEYVKTFEQPDTLLPSTWIVVRLDGRSFHAFTAAHGYTKPNDVAGLSLMNTAAQVVMASFPDIVLAFGASDEYAVSPIQVKSSHAGRHPTLFPAVPARACLRARTARPTAVNAARTSTSPPSDA